MSNDSSIVQIESCLKIISEEMRTARIARRLSKKEVAERVGVTAPTYDAVESGSSRVLMVNYLKCVIFFGMSDTFFNALAKLARDET